MRWAQMAAAPSGGDTMYRLIPGEQKHKGDRENLDFLNLEAEVRPSF